MSEKTAYKICKPCGLWWMHTKQTRCHHCRRRLRSIDSEQFSLRLIRRRLISIDGERGDLLEATR